MHRPLIRRIFAAAKVAYSYRDFFKNVCAIKKQKPHPAALEGNRFVNKLPTIFHHLLTRHKMRSSFRSFYPIGHNASRMYFSK